MADPAHVQILTEGPEALRTWRIANPDAILDLSARDLSNLSIEGASLEGANLYEARFPNSSLKNTNFTGADLTGANLSDANLEGADLTGAKCETTNFDRVDLRTIKYEGATFRGAYFRNALVPHGLLKMTDCVGATFDGIELSGGDLDGRDFSSCSFNNAKLADASFKGAILRSTAFHGCDLRKADMRDADCQFAQFERAILIKASLRNANLSGANLAAADFEEADVSYANFNEATLNGARMRRLRGAATARNLLTTRIQHPVFYFETAVLSWIERWCDWERVRIAGRLPLFAASYSVLIAIPFFFYALEIYNDKVAFVRSWANDLVASTDTNSLIAQTILQRLHPLPKPGLSVLLLVSTLLLAIAATIYAIWCPSRVKEFSRDQWTHQLGLSVVHYLAAAWTRRTLRLIALALYITGGTGAGIVLVSKLVNVARFLLAPNPWSL